MDKKTQNFWLTVLNGTLFSVGSYFATEWWMRLFWSVMIVCYIIMFAWFYKKNNDLLDMSLAGWKTTLDTIGTTKKKNKNKD